MAISDIDRDQMKCVAAYFESTRKEVNPRAKYRPKREDSRSINDTAAHFGITRSKVTKMLITMGVLDTPISRAARKLRSQGMTVHEIADALGVSLGTVSSNLPYEEEIHGSESASDHAKAMRTYRAYERMQKERQVQMKQNERKATNMSDDWKKDLDSRLSFTETDARRRRITYEMIRAAADRRKAVLGEEGTGQPADDREDERKNLRAKKDLSPDEVLELGEFPGALYDRNTLDLEEIYGEELPYEPTEMIRLHMELVADFTEEEKEIMHRWGDMKGDTISRDILVSDDLPLYALHFVIQRAFGFYNSHLHRFFLDGERTAKMTGSTEQWMRQVGVIYRSPDMDESAEFWADDYERGSFKNWLRKKYTGPCVSQCWDEGIIGCRERLKHVDWDQEFYVEYGTWEGNGEAVPLRCYRVYDRDGRKYAPPEAGEYIKKFSVEVKKLRDLPVNLLNQVFERGTFDLLERLSIGEVLAVRNMHCGDEFQDGDEISTYQDMLDDGLEDEIREILESGIDSAMKQPCVYSFTDELLYEYDFGDGWRVRITGSRNCADLVESGKITQEMLDRSNIKARVTYRPVLLARDGEMLIDDVGGPGGMAEFIKAINTLQRGGKDENGMNRTELKAWAKSQGWHKDDSTDYNLL